MVMHRFVCISTALSTVCVDNSVLTVAPCCAHAMTVVAAVAARVGSGMARVCGAGYVGVRIVDKCVDNLGERYLDKYATC